MDDLATWLREQIAADEAVATEATEGPWTDHLGQVLGGPDAQQLVADRAQVWNSDHITRHDPAAVLAQCEAHTAILDDSVDVLSGDGDGPDLAERTLRRLALAYQHRPGYRPEWRA